MAEDVTIRAGEYLTPVGKLEVLKEKDGIRLRFQGGGGFEISWLFKDGVYKSFEVGTSSSKVSKGALCCQHVVPGYKGKVFCREEGKEVYAVCEDCLSLSGCVRAGKGISVIDLVLIDKLIPVLVRLEGKQNARA